MRVISGKYRGRNLIAPEGLNTRPTLDRVKEAVFSMLRDDIYGATVLDLFAGSGALGIETLSRGAKRCFFNDKSKSCRDIIRKNLLHTKLDHLAQVSCSDFSEIIASCRNKGVKFDLILLDPPYSSDFYEDAIGLISKSGIFSDYCTILCEHSAEDTLPEQIGAFYHIKSKKYGTVAVSLFRNEVD